MSKTTTSVAALLGLLASLGVSFSAARGQGAPVPLSGFLPVGDYTLEVDGKDDPKAEVYELVASRSVLVLSTHFASPVLFRPGAQTVETLDLMRVSKQSDGSITILPEATLGAAGQYEIDGTDIVFQAEGRKARLKERTPLLGLQSFEKVMSFKPEYARNAKAYEPEANVVHALQQTKPPARVLVFFGSWCPHCTEFMPRLLRVEKAIAGSRISFDYYGLPRGARMRDDPEAKKYGINGVPTGIVFVGGKEVGRIAADGWRNPEVTLKSILDVANHGV